MQIILVSDRLRQARSVELGLRHALGAAGVVALLVAATSAALSYFALTSASLLRLALGDRVASAIATEDGRREESFVRDNINALAVRLGELQAQLTRLDALGERIVSLTAAKGREVKLPESAGRGGPTLEIPGGALSMGDLTRELEQFAQRLDLRGDALKVLEDDLVRERARRMLLPSATPIDVSYAVSGFGHRIDPFSGRSAMHEGVDFAAPPGTPILAAAAGLVIAAEHHPTYGNMVEVDHGRGIVTRYAHASKLHVRPGEMVKRGQRLADVGSTGQSTGPHLHFEVRENGTARDPSRFLVAGTK